MAFERKTKALLPVILLAVLTAGIAIGGIWYYTQTYMTMQGEEQYTIGLHGVFEDPGVVAKRGGRDVSDQVVIRSDLDTAKAGTYEITYQYGNYHASRTVTVLDHMQPELELKGEDHITINLGEEMPEPGYEAKGDGGRDITKRVIVSDSDFTQAGDFDVTYTVYDREHNGTRLTRKVTVLPNTDYGAVGLPICMFHYVYDENDPPEDVNRRYNNYISVQGLSEELAWLNSEGYYYPTWKEVREYTEGKRILPDKSIVLTFDDGEKATLEHLIPVLEKYKVPATSFMITSKDGENKVKEYTSEYLTYQSHTHDMHRASGVKGHRGIFSVINEVDGMADLRQSIAICGSSDAFAYPYGDYSYSAELMLQQAGFLCAVTTQYNKAYPGMDPLMLPRLRMVQGQTLERFQSVVSPPQMNTTLP